MHRLVAHKKSTPHGLQPRVELGDVRLEGSFPGTVLVVEVRAGEHGPSEVHDPLWRARPDGEVEFAPQVDWDIVLTEISGPPPSGPQA